MLTYHIICCLHRNLTNLVLFPQNFFTTAFRDFLLDQRLNPVIMWFQTCSICWKIFLCYQRIQLWVVKSIFQSPVFEITVSPTVKHVYIGMLLEQAKVTTLDLLCSFRHVVFVEQYIFLLSPCTTVNYEKYFQSVLFKMTVSHSVLDWWLLRKTGYFFHKPVNQSVQVW